MCSFCLRRVHVRRLARVGLEFRLQDGLRAESMAFRRSVHRRLRACGHGTLHSVWVRGCLFPFCLFHRCDVESLSCGGVLNSALYFCTGVYLKNHLGQHIPQRLPKLRNTITNDYIALLLRVLLSRKHNLRVLADLNPLALVLHFGVEAETKMEESQY